MQRGIATFTLDYGTCPKLGLEMTKVLVAEFGPDEFVHRIADPVWFQSLGTVLAFDWNTSGLTTILIAALKEAIRHQEEDLGVFICGGKDGIPYPVDRDTYDKTISTMIEAVRRSHISPHEKDRAISRVRSISS